jgi:hypothetical protein
MTKRSIALVGVLILMVMVGSAVIGAMSALASATEANGTTSLFLPLIMNAFNPQVEVPSGAVMYFNLPSCPSGWTEVTDAQGRAIVGLPSGGTLSGTVGTGLTNLEDRSHSHSVNLGIPSTSSAGGHLHSVNPPNTTSSDESSHTHVNNPYVEVTSTDTHNHQWSSFLSSTNSWTSYDSDTTGVTIADWGDGMDGAGSGHYPISRNDSSLSQFYYTTEDSHFHTVDTTTFESGSGSAHSHTTDIASFNSGISGNHSHTVGIGSTLSTTASTSEIMPYIQLLVCQRD